MAHGSRNGVVVREGTRDDLPSIVGMLADDPLGSEREKVSDPLDDAYLDAFLAIAKDGNNKLLVADSDGEAVGVLQLTMIPSLSHQGMWRAQVEGVRVRRDHRSAGVGRILLRHAMDVARERGCGMVQLATNKSRTRARAFYESLGFVATHEGMKLNL